jgi:aspartate kinase
MRKNIKVFKFGGASVKDADAIRNVASILKDYKKERLLVVVSAMGKTTNALEKVVHAFFDKKENAKDLLKQIEIEHLEISKELFGENLDYEKEVSKFVAPVNKLLQKEAIKGYDYIYDQVVSLGELLSTKLITTFLSSEKLPNYWLDARKIIKTDNTYREGNVNCKFIIRCKWFRYHTRIYREFRGEGNYYFGKRRFRFYCCDFFFLLGCRKYEYLERCPRDIDWRP